MESPTQLLRPQLEPLRRAWHGSPLPGFLHGWGAQLRACLPRRWRAWFARGAQWRGLLPEVDGWQLLDVDGIMPSVHIDGSLSPAQQQAALREACTGIDPQDLHLALCLPARDILRRSLKLPAAALANLHQVVAYEMDRQTPFSTEQVYFDTLKPTAISASNQCDVELVATPRQRLDPLLQRLQEAGIGLDAVDVLVDGQRLGANLLPAARHRRRTHPRRRLNLLLGAVLVLLAVLCMGQWLHNRRAVIVAMQAHVDAMHDEARAVMKLRQRLLASTAAAGFLARQRAQSPTVLAVLDDVSKRLPTDTWLQRFTIGDDGSIGMQGQSPQAARLVDILKKSSLLSEPGFQGVIQTDPRTHKERFYLTAHLQTPSAGTSTANDKGSGHATEAR